MNGGDHIAQDKWTIYRFLKYLCTFIGGIGAFTFTFYLFYAFAILDPVEKAHITAFLATRFPIDFSWILVWWIDLGILLGGFILRGIFSHLHKQEVGGPL